MSDNLWQINIKKMVKKLSGHTLLQNIHIYLGFKIFHGDDCVLGGHVIVVEIY